jgi:hypothetical protein
VSVSIAECARYLVRAVQYLSITRTIKLVSVIVAEDNSSIFVIEEGKAIATLALSDRYIRLQNAVSALL